MVKVPIACLLLQTFLLASSAFASPGDKVKALYNEGIQNKRSGRLAAAQLCFSAVIRQDSSFTAAYLELGDVYLLQHNLSAAKAQYQEVLTREPDNTDAMSALADVFLELLEAQCITPTDPEMLYTLAGFYYRNRLYDQAVIYWNSLLSIQPQNSFARFMLGKSYIAKGEQAKGEAMCDKALE